MREANTFCRAAEHSITLVYIHLLAKRYAQVSDLISKLKRAGPGLGEHIIDKELHS